MGKKLKGIHAFLCVDIETSRVWGPWMIYICILKSKMEGFKNVLFKGLPNVTNLSPAYLTH